MKDEILLLREQLRREDQDLLTLRVDRELSWRDIAHALLPPESTDEDDVGRLEVALRRRFTDVKKRLRQLATEAGTHSVTGHLL